MAVDKWKPSATAFCVLCCILLILPNAFVNSVRVQGKRVKVGAKGESTRKTIIPISHALQSTRFGAGCCVVNNSLKAIVNSKA